MVSDVLPDSVVRVLARMQSVLELELLLLIHEVPGQEWAPETLARVVQGDPERVRSAFVNLSRAGLVDRLYGGQSIAFQFNPGSATANAVEELAYLYVNSRASIVEAIETHATSLSDPAGANPKAMPGPYG